MATSEISGTSRSREVSSPSSAATMALDTRFLAPRTETVPLSGVPPLIVITSGMCTRIANLSGPG